MRQKGRIEARILERVGRPSTVQRQNGLSAGRRGRSCAATWLNSCVQAKRSVRRTRRRRWQPVRRGEPPLIRFESGGRDRPATGARGTEVDLARWLPRTQNRGRGLDKIYIQVPIRRQLRPVARRLHFDARAKRAKQRASPGFEPPSGHGASSNNKVNAAAVCGQRQERHRGTRRKPHAELRGRLARVRP